MIVPGAIPLIEGNMDALAGHARTISTTGQAFADTGSKVHNTWQGLYPHYIAPESGQLLAATGIVATTTASVGEDLGTAGTALATYADEVRTIQAALLALKAQAETLVAERDAAGEDWAGDSALVERDTQLIDAVNVQVAAFADAERRCANALRVLYGAPLLTAENGDGVLDPATEHGFTVEQLHAAARNGGTPWGATSEVDHPWPVDVLHNVGSFFGGLYQSGEGAVIGIGALVGIGEDGWSGETAGNAWGALGTLATGALVYGLVGVQAAERLDHNGSIPWLAPGAMGQSLEDAGKALIAYDQWDDDPARAAGATVGNVLLAVVGTKGAGAGLRAGGSAVGRIPGPVAARTSQALTGAGTAIGRIPTLTDVARHARNTFPGFRTRLDGPSPVAGLPDGPTGTGDSPELRSRPGADSVEASIANESNGGARPPAESPDGLSRSVDGAHVPPPLQRDVPIRTEKLEAEYLGENDPGNPQRPFYPDTVHYMSPSEREAARLFVEDGQLRRAADGTLFDTGDAATVWGGDGRAIFVMDEHGNLYASLEQEIGKIHHSSLLGGQPVVSAGELAVKDGVLDVVSRASGHYRPTPEQQQRALDALQEQGIDISTVTIEGF